jgi:hypothetical protein
MNQNTDNSEKAKIGPDSLIKLSDMTSLDDDHPALDIIIPKLDFRSQMKMAQLNKRLAEVVQINAEYELRKFQRHIRDDKFIVRISSNPKNWSFYRALIGLLEDKDETLTAFKNGTQYAQNRCEKSARDFSSICTLVKAERLGKELKENQIWRKGPPYRCEIDNGDWRLKINESGKRDGSKDLQVCTSRKNAEEWFFLPETWFHPLCGHQLTKKIIFNQNFVIINFLRQSNNYPELVGTGDFLVLNLASRKQFWAWKNSIDNEIKTRVTEFDHLGRQYDFNNDASLSKSYSTPKKMKVGTEEIKIKYEMNFKYGRIIQVEYLPDTNTIRSVPRTRLTLEADLEFKLDEEKEITGYKVVNVKIHRSVIEDDFIIDDSVPGMPMTEWPINRLWGNRYSARVTSARK